jgi:hypothetical protein
VIIVQESISLQDKMDHKQAYHSVSHHYSTKMMRTSLAVGVVWAVASLCLAIITGLVFMQVINEMAGV